MSLLARASWRSLRRHPAQALLTVLGVALGVTVVLGMDLANASARRAFGLARDAVTGRATHRLVAGPGGLPNELYAELRREAPGIPAAPVVEGWVVAKGGGSLHLLGIDPFADRRLRPALGLGAASTDTLGPLLTRPGAVLTSPATAERLLLRPGDRFVVEGAAGPATLTLVGLLEPADERSRAALDDLLVADVSTAQETLARLETIDRIDLLLEEPAAGERLASRAGPAVRVVPVEGARTADQMTRAFRWNLTALSLLALLCGAFLIYNTVLFSVVRRRRQLGILRTLGATRRRLFRAILVEAAALGIAGTLLGLAAGWFLGSYLLDLVTRTLTDLYFRVEVRNVTVAPWELAKAAGLGVGATIAAAIPPAFEATRVEPGTVLLRSRLEERARDLAPKAALAGLALATIGGLALAAPGGIATAFVGLFGILVGTTLTMPWLTLHGTRLVRPAVGAPFGVLGRLAARSVEASLSRTAVAIAALALAISVAVGVSAMIGSFRHAVEAWLEGSLNADVYVSVPAREPGPPRVPLPQDLVQRVEELPGLEDAAVLRAVRLASPDGPLDIVASRPAGTREAIPTLLAGDPEEAWRLWASGRAVLVSEPLAFRRGIEPGDGFVLPTDRGPVELPVAGIYRDYGSDRGVVSIHLAAFRRLWHDREVTALGLFAGPGTEPRVLADRARAVLRPGETVRIQTTADLLAGSLEVFDRTFAVTGVLRLLAVIVAFVGILAALMAVALDREKELGVLRAIGLTPAGLGALVTVQTGLMGLIAGILALPLGALLAAVMVHEVNRRSFGWSMELRLEPSLLAQSLLLGMLAALLAGAYPAWKMARTSPAEALREE